LNPRIESDTVSDFLRVKLEKRKAEGRLRQLTLSAANLIDFSSNDYLGFARMKELWEPGDLVNYGSTGSRLLTGNHEFTEETENWIARFHQAESGLIFDSGYDANTGLFSCIAGKEDTILYDELIHASVRDGVRLSFARHFAFRHNDMNHLEDRIRQAKGNIFIAVESVYSMDGDLAPLNDLVVLKKKYPGIHLIADEAHATGVIGKNGWGLVQESGLAAYFFARVHTFGKALGCQGAIVLGNNTLRDYLVNFSRAFIYTTALPLPNIIAVQRAYSLLNSGNENIETLKNRIACFRQATDNAKLEISLTHSAIQVMRKPGNDAAREAAKKLNDSGFDVRAILSPTVPAGSERIRICLHAFNTENEIDQLIDNLKS
jgi:8-amino-7-oxononanoate synthase